MEWDSIGVGLGVSSQSQPGLNSYSVTNGLNGLNGTVKADKGKRKLVDEEINVDGTSVGGIEFNALHSMHNGDMFNRELYAGLSAAAEERAEQAKVESNADYKSVSSCVSLLRRQLDQSVSDLAQLERLKQQALNDPLHFVDLILCNKLEGVPKRQKIAMIPEIAFEKYQRNSSGASLNREQIMRLLKLTPPQLADNSTVFCRVHTNVPDSHLFPVRLPSEAQPAFCKVTQSDQVTPSKITSSLVSSVEALARNTAANYSNRISGARYLATPTVFMPESDGGVDLLEEPFRELVAKNPSLLQKPEIQKMIRLERQKRQLKSMDSNTHPVPEEVRTMYKPVHHGFSCDGCGDNPIIGTRNHCKDCKSIDLCEKCYGEKWQGKSHSNNHVICTIDYPT